MMLDVFPLNNVLKNRGKTLILEGPVKIGTSGFLWSALHSSSHIHREIWQRRHTNSLISMGMYCMRESKQANNSYRRDEWVDAFSTAESSAGWWSICWFCHVTDGNKRDTRKTNDIILSVLTITPHIKVIIVLLVMCCCI